MANERSKPISFSPRRLAVSFYCGLSGKHARHRPGTPASPGLSYGTAADNNIHKFYSGENDYELNDELEYMIYTAPAADSAVSDEKVTEIYEVDGEKYIISGFTDVTFDAEVVEVKTGKQQAWHTIQALCYATIKNRPCRLTYITKRYSIVIQPDIERLKNIIRIAIHNERIDSTGKNEMCQYCTLKQSCIQWNEHSAHVDTIVSLKRLLENNKLIADDRKMLQKQYNELRLILIKYLTVDTTYVSNEYSLSVSVNDDNKRILRIIKRAMFKD